MQTLYQHTPVMANEVLDFLVTDTRGIYVDATFGRGGHSKQILEKILEPGRLFAFDRDPDAITAARQTYQDDSRFEAIHARFSHLKIELRQRFPDQVSGIFADLGVSSPQLSNPERGFSFQLDGPLDMRMNPREGIPASTWLQQASEKSIIEVLRSLGEERFAKRIARAIVERRAKSSIQSTRELAHLVASCVPTQERNKHPATRTFMAIRMHLNQELKELSEFLPQSVDLLNRGGRLVVITFHSIEDRFVKRFIRDRAIGAPGPDHIPFRQSDFHPTLKILGSALRPSRAEVERNRKARSSVLRVAERIG